MTFILDKGKPVVRRGRKAMGQDAGQEGAVRRGRQVAEGVDGTLVVQAMDPERRFTCLSGFGFS
jgi:hypothetical protein